MNDETLPPLPEPDYGYFPSGNGVDMWRFSKDQMLAFGRAAIAQDRARATAEPCSVCNALIVQRNPTHYDQQDLDAAKVRAGILHSRVKFE